MRRRDARASPGRRVDATDVAAAIEQTINEDVTLRVAPLDRPSRLGPLPDASVPDCPDSHDPADARLPSAMMAAKSNS